MNQNDNLQSRRIGSKSCPVQHARIRESLRFLILEIPRRLARISLASYLRVRGHRPYASFLPSLQPARAAQARTCVPFQMDINVYRESLLPTNQPITLITRFHFLNLADARLNSSLNMPLYRGTCLTLVVLPYNRLRSFCVSSVSLPPWS